MHPGGVPELHQLLADTIHRPAAHYDDAPKPPNMNSSRNPYLFPFLMVASLFLIWGFCHAMLDVLNKHFQNLLNLSRTQSGLIQTAFFIAYLLMAFPAALMIRRIGYQRGILVGLVVLAIGAFSFIPAGLVFKTFGAFLCSFFILSTGLACIETAANPYVTVLGPKEGSRTALGGAGLQFLRLHSRTLRRRIAPVWQKSGYRQPGLSFAAPALHRLGLRGARHFRRLFIHQIARH